MNKNALAGLVVTAFALFAMFFGAGNLILPAMIGVEAGSHWAPAAFGFLATGVLLPVLGMVAMATKREDEVRLADRIGRIPGLILTTLIFLSTGMLYAIPRVAAVSFEMVAPAEQVNNRWLLLGYTAVFFIVSFVAASRPSALVERIGGWLTPILLVLLALLIAGAFTLPSQDHAITADYVDAPFATGIIQGYFTMDALAALVFGSVIIVSLVHRGWSGKRLRWGMAGAASVAGVLLAVVYLGLVRVGHVGEGSNGAQVIYGVASELFGTFGGFVFGAIVVLACLTTALGLLGASSQYFSELVPRFNQRQWLIIHVVVAFALANLGLETIMEIVAPLNQLLYPTAICLILVSLLDMALPGRLYWAYRLSAWTAAFLSVFEALWSTGIDAFAGLRTFLNVFPLGDIQMAWVVPAVVMLVVGLMIDVVQGRVRHSHQIGAEAD